MSAADADAATNSAGATAEQATGVADPTAAAGDVAQLVEAHGAANAPAAPTGSEVERDADGSGAGAGFAEHAGGDASTSMNAELVAVHVAVTRATAEQATGHDACHGGVAQPAETHDAGNAVNAPADPTESEADRDAHAGAGAAADVAEFDGRAGAEVVAGPAVAGGAPTDAAVRTDAQRAPDENVTALANAEERREAAAAPTTTTMVATKLKVKGGTLSNAATWDKMKTFVKKGEHPPDILEFMKAHCKEDVPSGYLYGRDAPVETALGTLLTSLEAQVWCSRNKDDDSYFCKQIPRWVTELKLTTFSTDLKSSLQSSLKHSKGQNESDVVRLILSYARFESNDVEEHTPKMLKQLDSIVTNCDIAREAVKCWISEHSPSKRMPLIVSRGLVAPFVRVAYPLRQSPPTAMDACLGTLLTIASHAAFDKSTKWFVHLRPLLQEHVKANPVAFAHLSVLDEFLWQEVAAVDAQWWAKHVPFQFLTLSPTQAVAPGLSLAYRQVVEPDSLTFVEHATLDTELVALIKSRGLSTASTGVTTTSFEELQAEVAVAHERHMKLKELGLLECAELPEPVFPKNLPLRCAEKQVRELTEKQTQLGLADPDFIKTVGNIKRFPRVLSRLMGNTSEPHQLRAILDAARNNPQLNVDECPIDCMKWNADDYISLGIPMFTTWMKSKEDLKALIDFAGGNQDVIRTGQLAGGPPAKLFDELKSSLECRNGSDYRAFDTRLQHGYVTFYKNGEFHRVIRYALLYCGSSWKPVRDLLSRDVRNLRRKIVVAGDHRTKKWQDPEKKSILAAVGVLTTALPQRQRGPAATHEPIHIDHLLQGMSDALKRRPDLWDALTLENCRDLMELLDSFRDEKPTNEDMGKIFDEIRERGFFECQTIENYDAADGAARSHWLSIKSASNSAQEAKRYTSEQLSALLPEVHLEDAPQFGESAKFIATLKRFVDVGVQCLALGYREFVAFVKRQPVQSLLQLSTREINGRTTGFNFSVNMSRVTSESNTQLLESIRLVSSECEVFVGSIRELSRHHPVLSCFEDKEIGCILDAMLRTMTDEAKREMTQIVTRRLGPVKFDALKALATCNAELMARLHHLAKVLTGLCTVLDRSRLKPPHVWYLDKNRVSDWPLAVANIFKHSMNVHAYQVCLPIGTPEELLASRQSFLRRVRLGVCPDGSTSTTMCLVIPEAETRSATVDILKELCASSPFDFFIIVPPNLVSENKKLATFFGHATVRSAVVDPVGDFFSPSATTMLVVSGLSRSGKLKLARDQATEHFDFAKRGPTVECHECQGFLNETTTPHQLCGLFTNVKTGAVAIVEVGAVVTEHVQALIFSLAVRCWSTRDGAAVQRVNPVVLKVHTTLLAGLPILKLFHNATTDATRTSALLSHQYKGFMKTIKHQLPAEVVQTIADKLAAPSKLPLSAASFREWNDPSKKKQFDELRQSLELPEFLLTTDANGAPVLCCVNEETSGLVNNRNIRCEYLEGMSSDALWQLTFDVIGKPTVPPALIMTPSICLSLVRLDLSVKSRQLAGKWDDGVTTFVGETGCGKTQMVSTYCKCRQWREPETIHVHSGTTEAHIVGQVRELHRKWEGGGYTRKSPMVVFFDEFNTSPAQDMIKRIMLDRRLPLEGGARRALPSSRDGWIFIAACNPYAELSSEPRVVLKYTVQPHIAPSLVDTCWRLPLPTPEEEADIVEAMCTSCQIHEDDTAYFKGAIPVMHKFLGENAPHVPYSLRTVSRLLRLYRHLDLIACVDFISGNPCQSAHPLPPPPHHAQLALSVNYFVSLPQAKRTQLQESVDHHVLLRGWGETLQDVLDSFGRSLRELYNKAMPSKESGTTANLHRAASLNEALAVTYLCGYSQTPLFLIGPPGSSKTLASFMVLWGRLHEDAVHLRRLEPLYFQCSKHTTAHSIEVAIENAKSHEDSHASFVHVLDEIGNADQAAGHPLRALNQHLERSVFRKDGTLESVQPDTMLEYSSFIGTSNYLVDRSLLGRGIILQRDNPSVDDLKELLTTSQGGSDDQGGTDELASALAASLASVETMQSHENNDKPSNILCGNKLTMRDIYALMSALKEMDRTTAIAKSIGWRKTLEEAGFVKKQEVDCLQRQFLRERLCSIQTPVEPLQGPQYHSRLRPLMIVADRLSTVFAALNDAKPINEGKPLRLDEDVDIVYGKYLVYDEQLANSTLNKLEEAMVAEGRLCLLVGCEPLMDSLLDVFNGFYHCDDDDGAPQYTVRVVREGRSRQRRVTPDFNRRCIFVVIDSNNTPAKYFTPAAESRFDKIVLSSSMFDDDKIANEARERVRTEYLLKQDVFPARAIHGDHCHMFAALRSPGRNETESLKLLLKPRMFIKNSKGPPPEVINKLFDLLERQSLQKVVDRHCSEDNGHSLVLLPIENADGAVTGELQSAGDVDDLLQLVKGALNHKHQHHHANSLSLRSATPDMLFETAVTNVIMDAALTPSKRAVIGMSYSDSNQLTESHILAMCNFIGTTACDHGVRVILFAPALADTLAETDLTIPIGWRASFCDSVKPHKRSFGNWEACVPMLRSFNLKSDAYSHSSNDEMLWKDFKKNVFESVSEECVSHLSHRIFKTSVSAAAAEVLEYMNSVANLRWQLSLHYSNHKYFTPNSERWQCMIDAARTRAAKSMESRRTWLLSPARECGLPAVDCTSTMSIANGPHERQSKEVNALFNALFNNSALRAHDKIFLQREYLITLARLSGAQSNSEILFVAEACLRGGATVASIDKVLPLSNITVPLDSKQMELLRALTVVARPAAPSVVPPEPKPRCHILHEFAREDAAEFLEAVRRATTSHQNAVALANMCRACRERGVPGTTGQLNRVRSPAPLPAHPPSRGCTEYVDVFVRLALMYNIEFAEALFREADEKVRTPKAVILHRNITEDATFPNDIIRDLVNAYHPPRESLWWEATLSLHRYFKWEIRDSESYDHTPDATASRSSLYDGIKRLRDDMKDPCLSYLGHYVYAFRAMREHLFAIVPTDPPLPGQRMITTEELVGAVTLEMVDTLDVEGLPESLQVYLRELYLVEGKQSEVKDMNVLDAFIFLRDHILSAARSNNDHLTKCDALLKNHIGGNARERPRVQWPFVTIHHRTMTSELLDEVLANAAVSDLELACHFQEALVGIPMICTDVFPLPPLDKAQIKLTFQKEPSLQELQLTP